MRGLFPFLFAVFAAGSALAAEPFRLPVGARIVQSSPDGKGWKATGEMSVPFVQAKARIVSFVTASGWTLRHEIALGKKNNRVLISFVRGKEELTLMITRVATAKSSFSYGIERIKSVRPKSPKKKGGK